MHFDNLASGFIVIASDGVWEFIDSQQVVDLVAKSISKGSTVCTRPLPRALLPLRTGAPPTLPKISCVAAQNDMLGSRGMCVATLVRSLSCLPA